MTFAMTFPTGTHAMWIRYWLAAGGINPDKDAGLKVIPPATADAAWAEVRWTPRPVLDVFVQLDARGRLYADDANTALLIPR